MIIDLKKQYETYQEENPKTRIRDAAAALGVSEAELVATNEQNIRLKPVMQEILGAIPSLGKVMALTRNDHAVHERKGVYGNPTFNGHVGLVVGPDIDLRLFMSKWSFAFAVNENARQSIQFFDHTGMAVHKIYLTDNSHTEAFEKLVADFTDRETGALDIERAEDMSATAAAVADKGQAAEKPDDEIDRTAFQQEWLALQDTHDFFGLLRRHGVSRTQALHLAPEGHATPVAVSKIDDMLQQISAQGLEIMVFIGNSHCLQIHTGKAERIMRTGPWINILDADFNMHLRDEALDSVWVVKKPTNMGPVHSVEAYDAAGNLVAQFFGKRKPDVPERADWQEVVQSLIS